MIAHMESVMVPAVGIQKPPVLPEDDMQKVVDIEELLAYLRDAQRHATTGWGRGCPHFTSGRKRRKFRRGRRR